MTTINEVYSRYENLAEMRRRDRIRERAPLSQDLVSILWRRKLLVVGSVLVCLATGLIYIALAPSKYLASTSILIDPRLGKSVGSDPVMPGFVPDSSAMDSQIKLFTSQTVLSRAAKIAHLADDPEFNGTSASFMQRVSRPTVDLVDGVDLLALLKAITIKRPERTYVVGIDALTRDPRKSADIANAIAQAYIEDQIVSRVDAAKTDTTFVDQRLADLSNEIKEAQEKVEAYKIQNDIVDAGGLRSNEQQVSDLTRSLGDARAKSSSAKAKMTVIDEMAALGRLDASSDALTSVTMERLRQQQAETEQTVAKLATTLGPHHPELLEAEGRQTKINRLIRDELARLKIAAAGDYSRARDQERQIDAEVKRLRTTSASLNRALVPLEQLERNVRVLRSSFERFSQINDNLSQQQAESPPGRIISIARPPISPASPKKTVVGSISLAAGLFFGLAAALAAEAMTPLERTPRPRNMPTGPIGEPSPRPRAKPTRRYWDDDDESHA